MYSQKVGIDFIETYFLVVKSDSIQLVLVIVVTHKMHIHHFDIHTIFFNGDLIDKFYMIQPKNYVQPREETLVCRFKKSLYDIKQATTQWNIKFDTFFKEYNLVTNEVNPCVYHNQGVMKAI